MDDMQSTGPHTWIDWYRFAQRTLGLAHDEAVQYATVRSVEDENRARLDRTHRQAA
jgi:hypothetical protein